MSAPPVPPAVPVSVLRVYEPAPVFPAEQRARWGAEPDRADAGERADRAERAESWRRLVRGGRAGASAGETGESADPLAGHVRVLRVDGAPLVCPASLGDGDGPRRVLVRAWDLPWPWMLVVGLIAVPAPDAVLAADAVTAEAVAADGAPEGVAGLDGAGQEEPAGGVDGPGAAGRYLAPMAGARAQSARVLKTLRARLPGTELAVEAEMLARWLEGFHPRSWVELDARTVVRLLGGDDGRDDARLGMECLASGDAAGAAAAYQRLRQRSRALTEISRLS